MAVKEPFEGEAMLRLTDDTGAESVYELLDVISYGGEEYAVLFCPDNEAAGAVILQILPAGEDEPETYVGVDEDTMNAVFAEFRRLHKDELE